MIGLPERRKSMIASRTSWIFPHNAAALVGRMITLAIRLSTLALRSDSISERTVGGASKNWPMTPPGSISCRSPPIFRTSVELPVDLRLASDEQGHGDQPHCRDGDRQDDEHEHDPHASSDCHVTPPGVEYIRVSSACALRPADAEPAVLPHQAM